MQTRYRVAGVAVRLCWEVPALGAAARAALRQYGLEEEEEAPEAGGRERSDGAERRPPEAAPLTLRLVPSADVPAVPPAAEEVARFDDAALSAYRDGRRLYFAGTRTLVEIDPAAGRGEARVYTGDLATSDLADASGLAHRSDPEERLRARVLGAAVMTLSALLRHRGLYPMHAAALAHPETGGGVLLTAQSDCGKSTLACSLARQGWRYLSDDAVLLRPPAAEGDVEALAFRRHFTLDAEARRFFPEIAAAWSALPGPEEKGAVAMDALYPGGAARSCVPRLIVFPEIAEGQRESTLHPVPRVEAMHRALSQCALVTLEPERAPAHLDAARRLVGQTRHVRLRAGRDVLDRPARVAALIEGALGAVPHAS